MRKQAHISEGSSQGLVIHEEPGLDLRPFHAWSSSGNVRLEGSGERGGRLRLQNEPQHLASAYHSPLRMDLSFLARFALRMVKPSAYPQPSGTFPSAYLQQ